jgi:hypothetical protein
MVAIAFLLAPGCGDETRPGGSFVPDGGTDDADDDDDDTDDDEDADEDDDDEETSGSGPDDDDATTSDTDADPTLPDETSGGETTGGDPLCYAEPLDPDADVADVVAAYGGADWKDDLIEAMDRRWPAGAYLLDYQRDDSYFGQFSDSNSWTGMVGWLDTLVHEETHLFNAYHAQSVGEMAAIYFTEDNILYLPPEQGFPRSEIMPLLTPGAQNGIYAPTYLTGSQGDRGFNALLDELNCYENEVPGLAVFGEDFGGGVSLRDGSAAFLYFMEMYLRVAREDHPDFYDWAQGQEVYVEAVKTLWKRAHFFYEEVGDDWPNLGINDAMYRAEANKDENLAELEMFTGVGLDDSPCETP